MSFKYFVNWEKTKIMAHEYFKLWDLAPGANILDFLP